MKLLIFSALVFAVVNVQAFDSCDLSQRLYDQAVAMQLATEKQIGETTDEAELKTLNEQLGDQQREAFMRLIEWRGCLSQKN